MAIVSTDELHATLKTALGRGTELLYKDRKLLQERDYAGLASVIVQRIRHMKGLMWSMPLIGILQVVGQSAPYLGPHAAEASAADVLPYVLILLLAVAIFHGIVMSLAVPRLLALEQARIVVEMLLGDHEAEGVVAVNFE